MDTTKKLSHSKIKKIAGKSIETADTQIAAPVETAETIVRRQEGPTAEKGPGVVVPPKTEKDEFLERLSMYDEKEEEEKKDIRAQISQHGEAAPFLEKEVSDEAKQERFLEDLIIILKEKIGADIDRDEVTDILGSDKNIYDKIKTLLVISRAKNFKNLQARRDVFEQIHDFLDAKYTKDRRQVLNELADADVNQEEKNRLAAQILNPIEQNYKVKLADFKNEYLGLDLHLTKAERDEWQSLMDKKEEADKAKELGEQNIEDLTAEEYEKLKKLQEKIRIIKELEEI